MVEQPQWARIKRFRWVGVTPTCAAHALTAAARSLFFVDRADVYLPFYGDCTAAIPVGRGRLALSERTAFPGEGTVELAVESSTVRRPVTLHFFVPPGTRGPVRIRYNGAAVRTVMRAGMACVTVRPGRGDRVAFAFTPVLWTRTSSMPGRRMRRLFMHGPSVLGCDESQGKRIRGRVKLKHVGGGEYRVPRAVAVLRPLWDVRRLTREDSRTKVVF